MPSNRSKSLLTMTTTLVLAASLASGTEQRDSYSAAAYALDGGELLYVEKHVELWREGRLAEREVRYEDPSGSLIAEKRIRYGEDSAAPSFEMIDHRVGIREGAQVSARDVLLYSGPSDEDESARRLERPESAVVDAGFDAFMRDRFDAILEGEKLEFDFAVPALRRFLRFELVPDGMVDYQGRSAVRVRMRPAATLLRLLVDPIELTYSPAGRLLEFRGLANVLDAKGDRYQARIVFDYPSSAADRTPTPAARLGAGR